MKHSYTDELRCEICDDLIGYSLRWDVQDVICRVCKALKDNMDEPPAKIDSTKIEVFALPFGYAQWPDMYSCCLHGVQYNMFCSECKAISDSMGDK